MYKCGGWRRMTNRRAGADLHVLLDTSISRRGKKRIESDERTEMDVYSSRSKNTATGASIKWKHSGCLLPPKTGISIRGEGAAFSSKRGLQILTKNSSLRPTRYDEMSRQAHRRMCSRNCKVESVQYDLLVDEICRRMHGTVY